MMQQYSTVPTVCEAVQWYPGIDIPGTIVTPKNGNLYVVVAYMDDEPRRMRVNPGDYVVKMNGYFVGAWGPERFEANYKPIKIAIDSLQEIALG